MRGGVARKTRRHQKVHAYCPGRYGRQQIFPMFWPTPNRMLFYRVGNLWLCLVACTVLGLVLARVFLAICMSCSARCSCIYLLATVVHRRALRISPRTSLAPYCRSLPLHSVHRRRGLHISWTYFAPVYRSRPLRSVHPRRALHIFLMLPLSSLYSSPRRFPTTLRTLGLVFAMTLTKWVAEYSITLTSLLGYAVSDLIAHGGLNGRVKK